MCWSIFPRTPRSATATPETAATGPTLPHTAHANASRAHEAFTPGCCPTVAVMSILNRVAQLRAQGREVISLCAGEPSQGAPADVRRRAAELMVDRTPWAIRRPLDQTVAARDRRTLPALVLLDVDEDQIALTTGSSGAFLLGFLAAFDHGDRVALTRPGYPAYRNILASLGCQVVELACGPAERFQPSVEMLEQAHAAAPGGIGRRLSSQSHGTMIARDHLAELATWCRDHEVRLVSDEIYHGITDRRGGSQLRLGT